MALNSSWLLAQVNVLFRAESDIWRYKLWALPFSVEPSRSKVSGNGGGSRPLKGGPSYQENMADGRDQRVAKIQLTANL